MKKSFFTLLFLAMALSSCNPDLPSRSLIYGDWMVVNVEESVPCDNHYYAFLKQTDRFYFKGLEVTYWISTARYFKEITPKKYSMQAQKDGTWLLKIEGIFGWQVNEFEVASPVTIRRLTRNNMEWEYHVDIADSTLYVHYDLERVNPSNN